jgi:hypothetical protein
MGRDVCDCYAAECAGARDVKGGKPPRSPQARASGRFERRDSRVVTIAPRARGLLGEQRMDPAVLNGIAEIVVPSLAVVCFTVFGLMCFPSVRAALAERGRQRSLRHADATDVVAQLAALRGEVYALRAELAQQTHLLSGGQPPRDGLAAAGGRDRLPGGST